MRITNLISMLLPILSLGGVSCFLLAPDRPSAPAAPSPAQPVAIQLALTPSARPLPSGDAEAPCEAAFPTASHSESTAFLLNTAGRWYDALHVSILEGNDHIQEGLTVSAAGIFPSRFAVDGADESLKYTKELTTVTALRIGPLTSDGYRLIQIRQQDTCVIYALKPASGEKLLVRGPLALDSLRAPGTSLYEKFLAATGASTRLYQRFAEPAGQFTAVSSDTAGPNYVTRSSPSL